MNPRLAVFCVLVLTAGCLCGQEQEEAGFKYSTNPALAECNTVKGEFQAQQCYLRVAERKADGKLCEEIQTDNIKNLCYVKVVEKNNDKSLCGKIKDTWRYEQCMQISRD